MDDEERRTAALPWHARDVDQVLAELEVQVEQGLDADEVRARRRRDGPNLLRQVQRRPWWHLLLAQFRSVVAYLLIGAAVLALATERCSPWSSRWSSPSWVSW